jgi:hypothetical protein
VFSSVYFVVSSGWKGPGSVTQPAKSASAAAAERRSMGLVFMVEKAMR